MKLCWGTNWDLRGNGYGYTTHCQKMRTNLERIGVEMSDGADVAVHIIVPTNYVPIGGKFNVLFTMYEAESLPREWIEPLQHADLLVVPCEHNRHLFARYFKGPIEVCQEGIDADLFRFHQREVPEDTWFKFLWVGASNPRKGWEHIAGAWAGFKRMYPKEFARSMLIVKTTQQTREERFYRMDKHHMIFESHDYPINALIELYNQCHCFLFPSMGEGWGLTLHEAQATGLPCIYTPYQGTKMFMPSENAFPLKFGMKTVRMIKTNSDGSQEIYHEASAANPDIRHLLRRMVQVYHDYPRALEMGKRASNHVRKFTWEEAARRFAEIIEKHTCERLTQEVAA